MIENKIMNTTRCSATLSRKTGQNIYSALRHNNPRLVIVYCVSKLIGKSFSNPKTENDCFF